MSKIEMTKSQKKAYAGLREFINSPISSTDLSSKIAILQGKAGTGKTWLMKSVLKELNELDEKVKNMPPNSFGGMFKPNSVGITFTHKAKNQLMKSIPICSTFASFYGLKDNYDSSGEIYFTRKAKVNNSLSRLPINVLVFDECSMNSDNMVHIVNNYTSKKSKIIYVGDPGQLPPVQKVSSNPDKDSLSFVSSPLKFTLEERVRQTIGNPIVDLSDVVYSEIFGNKDIFKFFEKIHKDEINDSGVGFRKISRQDAVKAYLNSTEDFLDSKFITYRNSTLKNWNSLIRKELYDVDEDFFFEGELIYMNDTYRGKDYTLYNSSEYHVLGYKIGNIRVENHKIKKIKVINLFINKHDVNPDLKFDPFVPIVHPDDYQKYLKVLEDKKNFAVENNHKKNRAIYWRSYYDFMNSFGKISFGYAFTGHKAQGSGYKNIFLDINDLISVNQITTKRKLQALYTGITRASHNLYLIE